jgi:DNA-binding winged helix-turn-helix (wHTH) protein
MDDFTDPPQFWIGDLVVVPERNIVIRGGGEIKLEPRMMQVLVMLAEHSGETLSPERLLIDVWGCTANDDSPVYGDSSVSRAISLMRKAIGDDSRKPRYIETVSKAGYRLIPPVSLPENYRRMPAERWTQGSPYVGLSAFDSDHASVFCGRSRIIADLLKAMRTQIDNQRRFVLIVGASGCGKTSLLRAGAIPLLTKPGGFEGLHAISVVTCDLAGNGRNPMIPLMEALAAWTVDNRPVFPPQTPEQLMLLLTETPAMIEGFVNEAFRRDPKRDLDKQPYAHLLLTVDHAETLVAKNDIDTNSRDKFADLLQALCTCPHVMVTMIARGDFYLKLIEALPVLAEYKAGDGHLDVMAPRYGEIGEIIRSPAWKADLSFETDPDTRTRLDDALRDAAISQPDALPLLQHTLQALYERRTEGGLLTFEAYNEMGGLEGAIAHRADQVFLQLPPDARDALDVVMKALVNVEIEGGMVSSRWTPSDMLPNSALVLANTFVSARLFVSDLNEGRPGFRVVHEALLRRWPIAADWILKNQRVLQARESLRLATKRWECNGRRKDFLISQPIALSEALEVGEKFTSSLSDIEKYFVKQSKTSLSAKKMLFQASATLLAALIFLSIALSIRAEFSKKDAELSRSQMQSYADYILEDLTTSLRSRGDLDLLIETNERILMHFKDKPEDHLTSEEKSTLALALSMKGENASVTSDWNTLLESFMRSEAILDDMPIEDRKKRAFLASSINAQNLSNYYNRHHNLEKRKYYLSKWVESSERLYHLDSRYTYLENFSSALDQLALQYLDQDRTDEASAIIKRSQALRFESFDKTKVDGPASFNLQSTQEILSRVAEYRGNFELSRRAQDNNISNMRNRVRHENALAGSTWKVMLAIWLQNISSVNLATGRTAESIKNIQESVEILEISSKSNPGAKYLLHHVSTAYLKLGQTQAALGMIEESKKSLSAAQKNYDAGESDSAYKPFKAMILALSLPPESEEATESIQALIQMHQQRPGSISSAMATAEILLEYGKRHQRKGNIQEARTTFSQVKSMVSPWVLTTKNHRVISTWIEASILCKDDFPKAHVQRLAAFQYRNEKLNYLLELVSEADRPNLALITNNPQK